MLILYFGDGMKKYFHGASKKKGYFEGWYFKLQTADKKSIALIAALHIDGFGKRGASLQIITADKSRLIEFPETEFCAYESSFKICIGQSSFTDRGIALNVQNNDFSLIGKLNFGLFCELRSDIMGPFRYLPKMECSHGVISMYHSLEGRLSLNGEMWDFSGGVGYIETDRGSSFPNAYFWTQCLWNKPNYNSLMLSLAEIPIGSHSFTGCISSVIYNGKEYRLATYLGARVIIFSENIAVIKQGKYCLSAELLSDDGQPLKAPLCGDMSRTIYESVSAKMRYRFFNGKQLLFDITDDCGSFEYSGGKNTEQLILV